MRGWCHREEEAGMAQAMRAMQVTAMNGALAGSLVDVDTSVLLRGSRRVPRARRAGLSLRASMKEEQEVRAVVAPAAIASVVVLANAGAANALTAEDVTGTYTKVRYILCNCSASPFSH